MLQHTERLDWIPLAAAVPACLGLLAVYVEHAKRPATAGGIVR